jgi:hypothetical protein
MTSPKKRPSTPRSKAELKEAMDLVKSNLDAQPEVDATTAAQASRRRNEVLEAVKNVTAAAVINRLGVLGLEAQGALDAIKNMMVSSAQELDSLREAVVLTQAELAELHSKEVVAAALADLVKEHEARRIAMEESLRTRNEELNKAFQAQLNAERDRKIAVEQERKREEEAYQYDTMLHRRAEEDAHKQMMISKDREYADKLASFEKSWAEREASLVAHENEIATMRAEITAFPALLESEKKKAVDSTVRAISSEHKHQVELLNAAAASAAALAAAEIKALQQKVKDQDLAISALQNKLESAEKRVESIANSALASASGRQALEAASSMAATLKPDNSRKG